MTAVSSRISLICNKTIAKLFFLRQKRDIPNKHSLVMSVQNTRYTSFLPDNACLLVFGIYPNLVDNWTFIKNLVDIIYRRSLHTQEQGVVKTMQSCCRSLFFFSSFESFEVKENEATYQDERILCVRMNGKYCL